jgi:hypothetical protein
VTIILHNITHWERVDDAPSGALHTEGSLSKYLLRYNNSQFLFKETWTRRKGDYREEIKHQFWSEIVAAEVGQLLGLQVPETFIGLNERSDIPFTVGVLTKWFLKDKDIFVRGSELMTRHIENYSEKQHNLHSAIAHTVDIEGALKYWIEMIVFDCLIGNTDRHHENWGVINHSRLTPLYDNGISLGWRVHDELLSENEIQKNWEKFKFKMVLSITNKRRRISDFIQYFVQVHGVDRSCILTTIDRLDSSKVAALESRINQVQLTYIPQEYHLTVSRFKFMCDTLVFRANKLKEIVNQI